MSLNAMMFWTMIGCPAGVLIPVAILHYRREHLLRTRGTAATGRILELNRSVNDLGGTSEWATVEYTGDDGCLHTSRAMVRHADFDGYRVGQRVDLTYVPGRRLVRLD